MPYCRNCGCQLQEADNYCETCGKPRNRSFAGSVFVGKTCPYCQFPIKHNSELVVCSQCQIPHHRECWAENGGCTTFGCRGLNGETEIQSSIMQPTTITEVRKAAVLERSLSNPVAGNSGQRESGQRMYQLTYQTGELSLQDLPIGIRVVDPSWKWVFRTGKNYSGSGKVKPVTWIAVAKNHYGGLEPHVTLLAEELIGKHPFDNSNNRGSEYGSNHWVDSGNTNAISGLRPWLNSTGIHSGEGFHRAFSENFKESVLATTLPNREWRNGSAYSTSDHVFIPSSTELGDSAHNYTYQIGTAYAIFDGAGDAKRVACLGGETWWYWTRSPDSHRGDYVRLVISTGEFYSYYRAYGDSFAVRPALNLKSEILVSEIKN